MLEAIAILSRGQSFRGARARDVIQRGMSSFEVVGVIGRDGRQIVIGVRGAPSEVWGRINGVDAARKASLSEAFATLVFEPRSVELGVGPPEVRRRVLDWGCFYHDPAFYPVWGHYARVLRQRNAWLRRFGSGHSTATDELKVWDQELSAAAAKLTDIRRRYAGLLATILEERKGDARISDRWSVAFRQGWPEGVTLGEVLAGQRAGDLKAGYTRYGAHRADVVFRLNDELDASAASRGQLRTLAVQVLVAQTALFRSVHGVAPTLLVDDLGAELDDRRLNQAIRWLLASEAQVFVTSAQPMRRLAMDGAVTRMFHVEQGRVTEVL